MPISYSFVPKYQNSRYNFSKGCQLSFPLQNQVLKQNRDDDLRARMVLPSVNDPNVLVLQGVKKAARGNYSCRVGNGIPTHDYEVESQPIFLDVKCK